MAEIVFYGAISLDGYLAAQDHSLQWLFDTELGEGSQYEAFLETIGTTVMGRKTYEELLVYSEGVMPYKNQTNYVLTSQSFPDTQEVHFVQKSDPARFLQELKEQAQKDIWVVGGSQLIKPLLEADLIDQWIIQIAPVLLGQGIKLFSEGDYQQRLKLVEEKRFGEFIELHYHRS